MRRIQLYLEDDLDHALSVAAAQNGRSRSALMRDAVREWLAERGDDGPDAVDELIGGVDIDGVDDIDSVIYDR